MYLYLINNTDWNRASREAIRRVKYQLKSGNISSIRMASDLTMPISRSYADQSGFHSLLSNSSFTIDQGEGDASQEEEC